MAVIVFVPAVQVVFHQMLVVSWVKLIGGSDPMAGAAAKLSAFG
jgi:hypothetical protein